MKKQLTTRNMNRYPRFTRFHIGKTAHCAGYWEAEKLSNDRWIIWNDAEGVREIHSSCTVRVLLGQAS